MRRAASAAPRDPGLVDPGVFISALIGPRGSPPDALVRAFVAERIAAVASPLLLDELELVLRRPRFDRYADERTRREYVERIRRHATVVEAPADAPPVTRDPKDDYLVALARQERVDALVSGDRDHLDADLEHPPRQAVERIAAK